MLESRSNRDTISTAGRHLGSPVLLRADGLRKTFGGRVVLGGIDFELRKGEVVLLRGENGSGKTTLLNILTGNLAPDNGAIHYLVDDTPQCCRFPRRWWQELNPFDHFTPEFVAREGIGRTWQDVRLFNSQSLRDNIAVAAAGHPGENPVLAIARLNRSTRRESAINQEADAMLARFGLSGRGSSSADMVSLGQSKRVAIARAIAGGAHILFLDEPLAGLDRQGITDVLAFLEFLVRERSITLVIVEHIFNQPHLHGLVTTEWLLENGKLNRAARSSRKPPTVSQTRPAWFDLVAGHDAEVVEELLPNGALLTRIRRGDRFRPAAKPILEIQNLVVRRGQRVVIGLDDHDKAVGVNLTIYEGEIALLQACNGWGKSTLLGAMAGILSATSGSIRVAGMDISDLPIWERPTRGLHFDASGSAPFGSLNAEEVAKLAGQDQISDPYMFGTRILGSLSGGELRRVSLDLFLNRKNVLVGLLDEPFLGLDEASTSAAAERVLKSTMKAVVIAEPRGR